ncbi:MAG: pirin family protein [Flavobacteriales bacterium]
MSNNEKLIVEERSRDIGNFLVGRLLPFSKKRQVGPFTFIDHMGPSTMGPEKFMDVDQHPHIGLSTLTYLLEGAIEHKDSTGAHQIIHTRDVGFMTAGKGVAHTERTPLQFRDGNTYPVHGYQVWVALPKEKEEMEPRFDFVPHSKLPKWEKDGMKLTLIAGEGFGRVAPLPVHSPLFMMEVEATEDAELCIAGELKGEIAVVVCEGQIQDGENTISAGQMMISKTEDECSIALQRGTRVLLFGGEPFPEERFLLWNFASHSKDRLKQAAEDWKTRKFPKIEGDHTYIPMPEPKFKQK